MPAKSWSTLNMKNRQLQFIGLVLALAILLTIVKVPVASSQGQTLSAKFVSGELPLLDLESELWRSARPLQVSLSAQQISRPLSLETRTRSVTARALHNNTEMAILIEWADATQSDSNLRVQDFQDMVALQFPVGVDQPFYCMGQEGGNVEIWLWKAAWQADLFAQQEMETIYPDMYADEMDPDFDPGVGQDLYYPARLVGNLLANPARSSPVEILAAGGFGSLTSLPTEAQIVQGYGQWLDGKWQVIFSRELEPSLNGLVTFEQGRNYSVAFAAWDGAFYERNGQKSTSQWVSLQLERAAQASPETTVPEEPPFWRDVTVITKILIGALLFFLLFVAVIYFRLPEGN
jgi:hypothetical protein